MPLAGRNRLPHEMRSAIGSSLRPGIVSVKTPTVLVWTISPTWCPDLTQEATGEAEVALRKTVEQLDVMHRAGIRAGQDQHEVSLSLFVTGQHETLYSNRL